MTVASIDVSGRRSKVAVLRLFVKVVRLPFNVARNTD